MLILLALSQANLVAKNRLVTSCESHECICFLGELVAIQVATHCVSSGWPHDTSPPLLFENLGFGRGGRGLSKWRMEEGWLVLRIGLTLRILGPSKARGRTLYNKGWYPRSPSHVKVRILRARQTSKTRGINSYTVTYLIHIPGAVPGPGCPVWRSPYVAT